MRNHMLILLFNICVIASAMFLALTVHSLFAVIGSGVFLFSSFENGEYTQRP